MIEYANETVIKLLKQYDMLAKSLTYIDDFTQKNDICNQMTLIIKEVVEVTNSIYEEKYKKAEKRAVYLMEDEKNRLLELINLINERKAYINNQLTSNQELTGMTFDIEPIMGEDLLESYKENVKIIDRYKNNLRLESSLKEEIKNLDITIKRANIKISNNKNINKQLEQRMIRLLTTALERLSLFELKDREKEIELAYTELGYSLEKAKENAKIARKECSEEIIQECDNILASTTLDYERYKEKKLKLKLIYIYKEPVNTYEELYKKREEINNILTNIQNSELYKTVGNELNKEFSTIKLEAQDAATLKSLIEESKLKSQKLKEITEENNSEKIQGLLATLLENERKHQEEEERKRKREEEERKRLERLEEQRKLEELAKKQKEIEAERNKEIEERTKQLLNEKKKPLLTQPIQKKEEPPKKKIDIAAQKKEKINKEVKKTIPQVETTRNVKKTEPTVKKNYLKEQDDFFERLNKNQKVVEQGIPVIKNNNVLKAKKVDNDQDKIFPEIPLNKQEEIFPDKPKKTHNDSFFDEDEFKDLSNYLEGKKKDTWF